MAAVRAWKGFADSSYAFWVGLLAPAETPTALIELLNAATRKALESPEVRERLQSLGADPSPMTAQELDRMVDREIRENVELARKADIRLQ